MSQYPAGPPPEHGAQNAQQYYQQSQQPQQYNQPPPQQYPPQQQQYPPQQYQQPMQQPMQQQPMYAQPAAPVLVSPAAGGLMANNGVPQAQIAMTSAGPVTVGMPAPAGINCPPGLEYFAALDHIWVKELPQLIDQIVDFETNQKYQCLNNQGQQVYWSAENTPMCTRQCCGSQRPFHIDVHDPTGKIAMKFDRPLRCNSIFCCCFPINCCCLQNVTVTDMTGGLIGNVVQKVSFRPCFDMVDASGKVLCSVVGPFMVNCCTCFSDVVFNIFLPGNKQTPVGTLTKKFGGVVRELVINNADNFAVVFPMDLPISAKALLFATTFLIDFMFFERKKGARAD